MKPAKYKIVKTLKRNAETEAIMFVPSTPGSKLCRLLQEAEDRFSKLARLPRVKMVERGGKQLSAILCRSDPWTGRKCSREECFPCGSMIGPKESRIECTDEGEGVSHAPHASQLM